MDNSLNELANRIQQQADAPSQNEDEESEYDDAINCQEGAQDARPARRKKSGLHYMSAISKSIVNQSIAVVKAPLPGMSSFGKSGKKGSSNPDALAKYLNLSLKKWGTNSSASLDTPAPLAAASSEAFIINPEQKQWETFSKWLQTHHLIKLELPVDLPVDERTPPVPAWSSGNPQLKRVSVKKRFNSRKQPHLLEFENVDGLVMQMIYKQDDDISMDVSVMKLFEMCNEVWARRGMVAYLKTYKVVACPDLTGFGEIVPGSTMLQLHTDDMVAQLGDQKENWLRLLYTLIGVLVATAIFDVTDRHHNNVLFTPDCELALIDLSASLGKEAPMDKALRINPIYYPERIKNLREIWNSKLSEMGYNPDMDMKRWQDLEEAAIVHYYAIYNDLGIERVLDAVGYKMLKPHKFLVLLHDRKRRKQLSEGIRNDLVQTMDENDTFNSFVAGITRVVPMN